MEYNKRQFKKSNDKKVLHKVKKRWVVVSAALLMAIGGNALATHAVHAASNANDSNQSNHTLSNLSQSQHSLTMNQNNHGQSNQSANVNQQINTQSIVNRANALHRSILMNNATSASSQTSANSGSNEANSQNSGSSINGRQFNDSVANTNNTNYSNRNSDNLGQRHVIPRRNRLLGIKMIHKLSAIQPSDAVDTSGLETVPDSKGARVLIKYEDAANGYRVVGEDGEPVPHNLPYPLYEKIDGVPEGYYYTGIKGFNNIPKNLWIHPNNTYRNVPKFIRAPRDNKWLVIDVDVDPVKKSAPGTITIVYQKENPNGGIGQEINQYSTSGPEGHALPSDEQNGAGFRNSVPAGYKFVSLQPGETWPTVYPESGYQAVHIIVAPNGNQPIPQPITRNGNIDVNYLYNNNLVGQDTLDAAIGDIFNIRPYESSDQVPQGYQYSNVMGPIPSEYKMTPQTVNINLIKNPGQKVNQKGDINVAYNDVTNGKSRQIALARLSNGIGTPFDIQQYEDSRNIPDGYMWNGKITGTAPTQYSANTQTVGIDVTKIRSIHHETIQYLQDLGGGMTETIKRFRPLASNSDTPIDYNSMNQVVQQLGYQIIPSDTSDHLDKYINDGTSTIYVKKVQTPKPKPKPTPQPEKGQATIIYQDAANHKQVGQPIEISDIVGNPINYSLYTGKDVPANYQFAGYGSHSSDFSTTPSTDYLLVNPVQGSIDVRYVNSNNRSQVINSDVVYGNVNDKFNSLPNYEHDVTIGNTNYKYVGVGNGNNVSQFTNSPQTVDILMQPIVVPKKSTINLDYSASDGTSFSHSFTGDVGTSFDPTSQVNRYIPSDYHFDSYTSGYEQGQGPIKYTTDNQNINVKISKNKGTINVTYMLNGSSQPLSHYTLTSDVGNSFNPMDYAQANLPNPNKFKFDSISQGSDINSYGSKPQNLVVQVEKKTASDGSIDISYVNVKSNKQIGQTIHLTGAINSKFNASAYTGNNVGKNEPHYHYVKMMSNNVNTFNKNPQKLTIGVARDVGHITIHYRFGIGPYAHDVAKPTVLSDDSGTPFNGIDRKYLTNFDDPNHDDYVFDKISQGSDVHAFNDGNQDVVAQMLHNPLTADIVDYYAPSDSNSHGQTVATGRAMAAFNYKPYMTPISEGGTLPNGYKFSGFISNRLHHYGRTPGMTMIYVNKVHNSSANSNHPSSAATPSSKSATPSSKSKSTSSSSSQPTPSSSSVTPSSSTTPSGHSNASSSASSSKAAPSSSSSATPSNSTNPSSTSSSAPSSSTTPSGHSSASSSAGSSKSAPSSSSSSAPSNSTNPSSTSSKSAPSNSSGSAPSSSTTPTSSGSSALPNPTPSPSDQASTNASGSTSSSQPEPSSSNGSVSPSVTPSSSSNSAPSSSSNVTPSSSTTPRSTSSSAPSSSNTPTSSGSSALPNPTPSPSDQASTNASGSSNSAQPEPSSSGGSVSPNVTPSGSTSNGSTHPSSSATPNSRSASSSNVAPSSKSKPTSSSSNKPTSKSASSAPSSSTVPSGHSSASSTGSSKSAPSSSTTPTSSGSSELPSPTPTPSDQASTTASGSSNSAQPEPSSSASNSVSPIVVPSNNSASAQNSANSSAVSSAKSSASAASSKASSASRAASSAKASASAASSQANHDNSVASSASSRAASMKSAASSYQSAVSSAKSSASAASSAASSASSAASTAKTSASAARSQASYDSSVASSASSQATSYHSAAKSTSSKATSESSAGSRSAASSDSTKASSEASEGNKATSVASSDSSVASSASQAASKAASAASVASSRASSASRSASVASSVASAVSSKASSVSQAASTAAAVASADSSIASSEAHAASVTSAAASTANSLASSAASAASLANSTEQSVDSSASSAASSKSVAPQIITSTSTSVQYVPMPIYEPASGSSQAPINVINVPNSASTSPRSTAAVSSQPETTIDYVDNNGHQIMTRQVPGTNTDFSQYTQNVPSGYKFDRILGTGNLANNNRIATIELSPISGESRHTAQSSQSEPSDTEPESEDDGSGVHAPSNVQPEYSNRQGSINGSQPVNENETADDAMANGSINGNYEPSSTTQGQTQNRKLPQTGEASEHSEASLGLILVALGALMANLGRAMDRRRHDNDK